MGGDSRLQLCHGNRNEALTVQPVNLVFKDNEVRRQVFVVSVCGASGQAVISNQTRVDVFPVAVFRKRPLKRHLPKFWKFSIR